MKTNQIHFALVLALLGLGLFLLGSPILHGVELPEFISAEATEMAPDVVMAEEGCDGGQRLRDESTTDEHWTAFIANDSLPSDCQEPLPERARVCLLAYLPRNPGATYPQDLNSRTDECVLVADLDLTPKKLELTFGPGDGPMCQFDAVLLLEGEEAPEELNGETFKEKKVEWWWAPCPEQVTPTPSATATPEEGPSITPTMTATTTTATATATMTTATATATTTTATATATTTTATATATTTTATATATTTTATATVTSTPEEGPSITPTATPVTETPPPPTATPVTETPPPPTATTEASPSPSPTASPTASPPAATTTSEPTPTPIGSVTVSVPRAGAGGGFPWSLVLVAIGLGLWFGPSLKRRFSS